MKLEFALSENNPAFRIYRVADAPSDFSFLLDPGGKEELVIFDGDEMKAANLHHETALRLGKLSRPGRDLANRLFPLPFRGVYIAIDQAQLIAKDHRRWADDLHSGVIDALNRSLAETVKAVEVSWETMITGNETTTR